MEIEKKKNDNNECVVNNLLNAFMYTYVVQQQVHCYVMVPFCLTQRNIVRMNALIV